MKIIETSNYLRKKAEDFQTFPSSKVPLDISGSCSILVNDADGVEDIENKWRKRNKKRLRKRRGDKIL